MNNFVNIDAAICFNSGADPSKGIRELVDEGSRLLAAADAVNEVFKGSVQVKVIQPRDSTLPPDYLSATFIYQGQTVYQKPEALTDAIAGFIELAGKPFALVQGSNCLAKESLRRKGFTLGEQSDETGMYDVI